MLRVLILSILSFCLTITSGCADKVNLVTLDPGHYHASLVQKSMYEQVDPLVYVYAPDGPDVANYSKQIQRFNERE